MKKAIEGMNLWKVEVSVGYLTRQSLFILTDKTDASSAILKAKRVIGNKKWEFYDRRMKVYGVEHMGTVDA